MLPIMITERDEELLGVAHRTDPMGVLAVWQERARSLVPHLTEQSVSVRGFQILVEGLRLWERYVVRHPEHAERVGEFFVLVEQAFARTVAWHGHDWTLPGARRVRARHGDPPHISWADRQWHLLENQQGTGIWGQYFGAARRAGLLDVDAPRLSGESLSFAEAHPGLSPRAERRLLEAVAKALEGATVELPDHGNNVLCQALCSTYLEIPIRGHLKDLLVDGDDLNRALASRLRSRKGLDHRALLERTLRELPAFADTLREVIRCEDLLAVVDAVFLWLCAHRGSTVQRAVSEMPLDLDALRAARMAFLESGTFRSPASRARVQAFQEQLDTRSREQFARSLLQVHRQISEARGRAAWIAEEDGVLVGDVDESAPGQEALQAGVAWRNDYYLSPLKRIADELAELQA